jgi:hypothetical protein
LPSSPNIKINCQSYQNQTLEVQSHQINTPTQSSTLSGKVSTIIPNLFALYSTRILNMKFFLCILGLTSFLANSSPLAKPNPPAPTEPPTLPRAVDVEADLKKRQCINWVRPDGITTASCATDNIQVTQAPASTVVDIVSTNDELQK